MKTEPGQHAPVLAIVQRPGAKQVALVVGERVPGPSDSDYARLRVANALLGGSLISRITMNIREAHGYAYAPASELVATPSGGAYWAEQVNVAAPVAWPALTGESSKRSRGWVRRRRVTPSWRGRSGT